MHRHVARTPTAEIRDGRFVHCATAMLLQLPFPVPSLVPISRIGDLNAKFI